MNTPAIPTAPTIAKTPFVDPTSELSDDLISRTTVRIDGRIRSLLMGLHPDSRTVNTVINLLLQQLAVDLHNHNLTSYDPAKFREYMSRVVVLVPPSGGTTVVSSYPNQTS